MTADTSPSKEGRALWRVNTELRERNAFLERELAKLQAETAVRRRLTSVRSSVSGGGSVGACSWQAVLEQGGGGPAEAAGTSLAAQAQLAALEAQAADYLAGIEAANAALEAARAEAGVAQAGIARLSGQLSAAQQEAEELRGQVATAREAGEQRARAAAERSAKSRARLRALEMQVDALLREAAQRKVQEEARLLPGSPRAAASSTAAASPRAAAATSGDAAALPALREPAGRLSPGAGSPHSGSPRAGGGGTHVTRVYNLMLPPSGEGEAQESTALQEQVAHLQERLAAAEAELAAQLAAKEEAQQALSAQQAEMAGLQRERQLLQEQAVSLQQEVSAWQQGRGEAAAEPVLERSPSRTLVQRMKEMLGGSPGAGRRSPGASQRSSPPSPSRSSRPASRAAAMPEGPEGAEPAESAGQGPLLQGLAQVEEVLQGSPRGAGSLVAVAGDPQAEEHRAVAAVPQLPGVAADDASHRQCRAAIEGVYAQMWRERLGRQRAQAEAVDLRLRLSSQLAAVGCSCDAQQGAELDETEMQRADHYAEELRLYKAQQARLQRRAEELELKVAQYSGLLGAAEQAGWLPSQGSGADPPSASQDSPAAGGSPSRAGYSRSSPSRGGRGGAAGSPAGTATATAKAQARRAGEEVAALQEQLKAAQTEVARVRRRERESLTRRRRLEERQAAVVSGLHTLQRLLVRKSQQVQAGSLTGDGSTPAGRPSRAAGCASPTDASGAMAALSALLRELQAEETAGSQVLQPPPRSSDTDCASSGALGGAAMPQSLSLPYGAGSAEKQSDPLDISLLLPEGAGGSGADPPAGALPAIVLPGSPPASGQCQHGSTPWKAATAESQQACACGLAPEGEPGAGTIPAVRHKQGLPVVALQATSAASRRSSTGSRIPAAPPAKTASAAATSSMQPGALSGCASPAGGSPSKARGLRKLFQASCRMLSPRATLSSTGDAGRAARTASPAKPRALEFGGGKP